MRVFGGKDGERVIVMQNPAVAETRSGEQGLYALVYSLFDDWPRGGRPVWV